MQYTIGKYRGEKQANNTVIVQNWPERVGERGEKRLEKRS